MLRPSLFLAYFFFFHPSLLCQQGAAARASQPGAQIPSAAPGNPASLPSQELTKLTARADLVLVPVIVTDKAGKHVSGLRKDAFRIEVNGNLRSVSVFEEDKTEKLVARAEAAPSPTHSNFVAGDDRPWRLTAILLDMVNTPSMRQLEAKKQLTDDLLRSASAGEPMAIFGLNGSGLHQLHPFTSDPKVLINALQKLRVSLSSDERSQLPEALTDDPSEERQASEEAQLMTGFMQELSDTMAADYQRFATRDTLLAMTQLAHAFQGIPGRKTLIWASAGFPFTIDDPQSFARQGDDLRGEYEDAWRALNSANIAVYPVDLSALDFNPRELPSANSGMSSSHIADIRGINGLKPALRLPYEKDSQQRLTLHAFADATGGAACVTVNELEKCFAEAVDDSRDYYLLGFYLGGDVQPGWRKLKVKVAGDGLRVRSRSGFYVTPRPQESAEVRRKQLVNALEAPVEYTGLRLTARLLPLPTDQSSGSDGEPKRHAAFMLGVMGNSVSFDREKGNAIDIEVAVLAFDSNRKSVATASQAIAVKIDRESMQKTVQTGLGIPEKLDIPPGKYEVKFAVRDNPSGLIGTIGIPIELK